MKLPVYSQAGEELRREELEVEALGPVKVKLLKQVVLAYEANRRVGTASTKRRGEVTGSGRKLYRQKGTGFARMGDRRNPVRVGGGVAHGPRLRDYRQAIPRGMRRRALASALSGKLRDGEVRLLEGLSLAEPKTRAVAQMLERMGCGGSCLLVLPAYDGVVLKSVRNLPRVVVREAREVTAYDLLRYHQVVFVGEALAQVMERSGAPR